MRPHDRMNVSIDTKNWEDLYHLYIRQLKKNTIINEKIKMILTTSPFCSSSCCSVATSVASNDNPEVEEQRMSWYNCQTTEWSQDLITIYNEICGHIRTQSDYDNALSLSLCHY